MVKRKKIGNKTDSTLEKIKKEVLVLLTGQDINKENAFNYFALVKRITVILIGVYGITRVGILRQLAFSIATTFVTGWLAEKAALAQSKPALRVAK